MSNSTEGWTVATVDGKRADVYQPPLTDPDDAVVIFLHDQGQQTLASDAVFTEQLATHRLRCICPHGGRCWWLDVVSREFDEGITPMAYVREQVVDWIENRWSVRPPAIGLLGIGMGGQGALQLAYRHARTFPVVAAVSPAVDFHILHGQGGPLDEMFASPEAARQQTTTLHLHPLNWPPHQLLLCDRAEPLWHDGCARLASKLTSIGIPYESDLESSVDGDCQDYARRMAPRCVSFLAKALRSIQSR